VEIGRDSFRTEADGSARPWFSGRRPERFVSALDVLNGTADGDLLRRSFVLIGVTGLALGDYVWTPVAKMPGVEVHAQVLENMQERTFLVRPPFAPFVEAAALLVAGALLIALVPRWPVPYATLAGLACVAAILLAGYAGFHARRWLLDAATL